MIIKEFFAKVQGIPQNINVVLEDTSHPYMGPYEEAPEEILNLEFSNAIILVKPMLRKIIYCSIFSLHLSRDSV